MPSQVTVRFYRVNDVQGQASLADCLDDVLAINLLEDRNKFIEWANYRIECGDKRGHIYYGDFYRLQDNDFPPKVGKSGPAQPLGLPPDHSLGHRVAFGYDSVKRVLGIQKRATAPSAMRLTSYLSLFKGVIGVTAVPIVHPDDIGRLNGVSPRKFNIRIAEPSDLAATDGDQRSFKQSLEAIKRVVGAPYITLSVGMGGRSGEVPKPALERLSSWLFDNYVNEQGGIKELSIAGRDNNEDCVLDLLNAHLGDKTELDLPSDDLTVNYERRRNFIETLFRRFDQEF